MTQPQVYKHYRCRFCGITLPAWLRVPQVPDGAMLLWHLGRHPDKIGPYLERMRSEDIGTVAAEAFEVIENNQPEDDERRAI